MNNTPLSMNFYNSETNRCEYCNTTWMACTTATKQYHNSKGLNVSHPDMNCCPNCDRWVDTANEPKGDK